MMSLKKTRKTKILTQIHQGSKTSTTVEIDLNDESQEDEEEEDINSSHSSNTRQGQEDKNIRGDSDIMDHSDDSDVIKKPDCEESDILVKEVSDSNLLEDAKDDDKGDKVGKNGLTKNQRRKLNRKLKIEYDYILIFS